MNARSQALFWLMVLAAALLLVWLLSAILFPFVLGIALAYFLDPAAAWLERRGWSRMAATVVIGAGFFGAGLLLLLLLIPPVVEQAADLLQRLPGLVSRLVQSIGPLLARALNAIGADQPEGLHQTVAGNLQRMAALGLGLLKGLMGGGAAVINVASLLTITPLTTFYVLRQWPGIIATVDGWLPRDHADTVRGIMRDIDVVLKGFPPRLGHRLHRAGGLLRHRPFSGGSRFRSHHRTRYRRPFLHPLRGNDLRPVRRPWESPSCSSGRTGSGSP